MTKHFLRDTTTLLGRSLRHILRSPDTIITTAITPIAMLLMFVYVFGGAIDTGGAKYVNYLLPGHPADHGRVRRRLHGVAALHRRLQRDLRAVPVDADRPLGGPVGARADLA